jgi:hypothetical protein
MGFGHGTDRTAISKTSLACCKDEGDLKSRAAKVGISFSRVRIRAESIQETFHFFARNMISCRCNFQYFWSSSPRSCRISGACTVDLVANIYHHGHAIQQLGASCLTP